MVIRSLFLAAVALVCCPGGAFAGPQPLVIVVKENPPRPVYFDPFYNQPKVIRQPQYFFESTNKKTKGNKVYKTTIVKNQYGQTVYKDTTVKKKKK